MANTFELIASSTVGSGGAASIDFTSIPSTYTDLVLKISCRTNSVLAYVDGKITFNGSGSSYSWRSLYGTGSATGSGNGANQASGWGVEPGTYTANTFGNAEIYMPNYAGSNYKSWSADSVNENNATGGWQFLNAGLWSSTSAITSISIADANSNNFVQYSTAYLYGVKNA
jgi:hypothetical protein